MKRTLLLLLVLAAAVCALPWTPLWKPILSVGYAPLCLLGVDRWFSASETLVLSDGTDADLSDPNNPARRAEIERVEWLCNRYRFSSDFMLWADDPGSGPTITVRAEAWSPDRARGLARNVVEKYNAGEGPPPLHHATPSPADEPHAESAEGAEVESHAVGAGRAEIQDLCERLEKLDMEIEEGQAIAKQLRPDIMKLLAGTNETFTAEAEAAKRLSERVPRTIVPPDIFSPATSDLRDNALKEWDAPVAVPARRQELLETLRRAESKREKVRDALNAEIEALTAVTRVDFLVPEDGAPAADAP